MYVANRPSGPSGPGWVTPISTATNTAGPRVDVGPSYVMAATPNGKTVYVASLFSDTVIPISTATNTAGRPIKVARFPFAITITPDGKIAYVLSENSRLTPIMTATNTAGQPITINPVGGYNVAASPAITPDGKTIYVSPSIQSDVLVPVKTATDKAGKPIRLGAAPTEIVITPDGKTAYTVGTDSGTVTPIAIAMRRRPEHPSKSGQPRLTSRSPRTARPPTWSIAARTQ